MPVEISATAAPVIEAANKQLKNLKTKVKSTASQVEEELEFLGSPEYNPVYVLQDAVPRFMYWLSTFSTRFLDFSPPIPTYQHDGEYPSVENVPWIERIEFFLFRGPRYFANMFWGFLVGTFMVIRGMWKVAPISDAQLSHQFSHSVYAKFLRRVDVVPFPLNNRAPNTPPSGYWYYLCDFSFVPQVKTFPEFHTAETFGVFRVRKDAAVKFPEPVAIQLSFAKGAERVSTVFVPGDRAWGAAKLFLMQGAFHMGALVEHPKIHFPYDCMNAYTHHLPDSSLMKQLLWPHTKYTLALNDTVLNSAYLSIVVNPGMIQSPFDAPGNELRKYLQETKREFKYSEEAVPEDNVFAYGTFLRRYHDVIYNFVSKVYDYKPVEFQGPAATSWADDIAAIVPGFPNGKAFTSNPELAKKVLSQIIHNLSVHHSADHYTFYCIPWNNNPWRIRQLPPASPEAAFNFNKAHSPIDMWKLAQTNEVFFYTGAGTNLRHIEYHFKDQALKKLQREFRLSLATLDALHDDARVMELDRIGWSIDY